MLDSQLSRKMVVAVGLAAAFSAAIYEFAVRTEHTSTVAQSAPPPAGPPPPAPTSSDPTMAAQTAGATAQPSPAQPPDQPSTPPSSPDSNAAVAAEPSDQSSPAPAKAKASSHRSERRVASTAEPNAADQQITVDVKSQIATAAPDSNVDVTTTNGVVALAGTVPSQIAAFQARQAALRVAGVKDVDASALQVGTELR